ncbi:signal peptide peptidase SppA [Oleiharenicola lentus]|uniref:signal peptide peptidase SppA n=1 Tax=Oleiharenicola lentus TaxID=2508720 RepID=UPI003F676675
MKNFFTSFFATLSALIVFLIGACLMFFLLIAAIAAMGQKKPVMVQDNSYLVLDLSANIQDSPAQADGLEEFAEIFGGSAPQRLQLREVTRALQAASKDSEIKGLYITGSNRPMGYGSGYAALKEMRAAIETFKASGKPVKAYLENADTRDLYVASVASELVLNPYGFVAAPGLASQPMFLTGAFEKFGIGVQVTRVGKYKSAVEPFTRKDMSPENRAQTQKLLDDVWGELTASIEDARKLPAGTLQKVADEKGFLRGEQAKELKVVDRVAYLDEVLAELKAETGRKGSNDPFRQVSLKEYSRLVSHNGVEGKRINEGKIEIASGGRGKIAIVYAEGEIVDGDGNDEGYVYGARVARLLRQVREDSGVKALVLRVNSPGGSVSASEEILREVRLINEKIPIVVSMGSLAASGGYWISTASDRIFAEPTTITGSIGVFGMFLNFQGLATDKIGLTFDTVKTGKFADLTTVVRPKTPEELALFQGMVDWVYDQFLTKVVDARKLDRKVVEEIAQGRVWSGAEALKLGLVDQLGGLSDAISYAAEKAGLGEDFRVSEYPRRRDFAESLRDAIEGKRREQAFAGPVGALVKQATQEMESLNKYNDPRGLYARLPFNLRLN